MKKLWALIILCICLSIRAVEYDPKGLLIFVDDYEGKAGVITRLLVTALMQNAGPIIASTSLLLNIVDEGPEYIQDLFNFDHWVIKNVDNLLCLLIPRTYLHQKKIAIKDVEKFDPSTVHPVELKLGLKVNHFQSVKVESLPDQYAAGDIINHKDYFVKALGVGLGATSFFCTRTDYLKKQVPVALWSIYAAGHGLYKQEVIGLSINEFRQTLDFFSQKLNVRFFMYFSCYAAGLQNELIYTDIKSAITQTYPFAIVTQGATDSAVGVEFNYADERILNREQRIRYDTFLQDGINPEGIDYAKAVENLIELLPQIQGENTPRYWGNVPQIKLPGLEWFSVLASKKDIVSIGSVLSRTRKAPLNVNTFFKADPKAILLYGSDIRFELIVNPNNLEAIISMIPGDAIHRMAKIRFHPCASQPSDKLDWFMMIRRLDANKIFYIKEFDTLKNVVIHNIKIQGDPSKNILDRYERYGFFYDGGTLYTKIVGNQAVPVNEDQKKLYERLLEKIKRGESQSANDEIQKISDVVSKQALAHEAKKREESEVKAKNERIAQETMDALMRALKKAEQELWQVKSLLDRMY